MKSQKNEAAKQLDRVVRTIEELEASGQDRITTANMRLEVAAIMAQFDQADAIHVLAAKVDRVASVINQGRSWH